MAAPSITAEYFRKQAAEARQVAERALTPEARKKRVEIAADIDQVTIDADLLIKKF
jgi:plasmid stability protein